MARLRAIAPAGIALNGVFPLIQRVRRFVFCDFNVAKTGVCGDIIGVELQRPAVRCLSAVQVVNLYGGIGVFVDVEPYRRLLFAIVGFTWSFHVTFAIWMLWQGQTDLIEHGTFFSMMVIYLINFAVLSIMLIVACRDVTFAYFGKELLEGAIEFSDGLLRLVHFKG